MNGGYGEDGRGLASRSTSSYDTPGPSQIQAYAKLQFEASDFYIKKLSVTIGRRTGLLRPPVSHSSWSIPPSRALADQNGLRPELLSPTLRPTSATRSTSPGLEAEAEVAPRYAAVLGRPRLSNAASPPANGDARPAVAAPEDDEEPADVDLGAIKAVSRCHARIFYQHATRAWQLEVQGRNGVVIDSRWTSRGEIVTLRSG